MIALRNPSIRSAIRTITLLAALTSLLLTMVTPFVGAAWGDHDPTDPLSHSPYSIDGTIPDAGALEQLDPCPGGNEGEDPVYSEGADDGPINGDSTKLGVIQTDTPPTMDLDINHPGKSDLCKAWIADAVVEVAPGDDDYFLYVAWEREAVNGSTIVFYEFHQQELACTTATEDCNPFNPRTDGDFMLTFDFVGNAVTIYMREWEGDNATGHWLDPVNLSTLDYAEGALNASTSRGEAAINLSAAGIIDPDDAICKTFSGVIPGTVTGNSDTADYKDVILSATQPVISNCGTVVVKKQVVDDGGTPLGTDYDTDFPVTLTDGGDLDRTENLGDGEQFTETDVFQGNGYTVSEDLTGLTGWSVHSISCDDGSSVTDGSTTLSGISVDADTTTTCVVKNTPDLPDLTLLKDVVNDNGGGADFSNFTATSSPDTGIAFQDADDVDPTSSEVDPDTYTLGEDDPGPGYELTSIVCDNGVSDLTDPVTVDVTLDLGDDVTCTFTNDDQPGTIVVEKTIIDPDGLYTDATQGDFAPTIDGDQVAWDVDNTVDADTYSIDEEDNDTDADGDDGYLADGRFVHSSTVCDDTDGGDAATVGVGETVTCTITNTAVGAGLVLVKDVDNDWGGSLEPGDFTLQVDGDNVGEGQDLITYPAGEYTIREIQEPGYEFDGLTCLEDGGAHPATPVDGEDETFTVDVAAGESVVCTFYNSDLPGELTVFKEVVNDDGGTAVADDFTSDVDYTAPEEGTVAEGNEPDGSPAWGDTQTVPQGDYVVGETDIPAGYDLVGVECFDADDVTNGQPDGGATPISTTGEVAISYDDDVVCIVTNDDLPSQLTLVKQVTNDDGGTATEDDFTPTLAYDGADDEYAAPDPAAWDSYGVPAGTFTLGEVVAEGYDLTSISCIRNDDQEAFASSTGQPLEFEVALGDDVTCTVANDDQPATLILDKVVINDDGGTADKSDFTPTIDFTALPGADTATNSEVPSEPTWNDEQNPEYTVPAGDYTIGELIAAGYLQIGISCDVDGETVDGAETASFTLGNGETADCVITNDDIAPGLTVVKQVINDDGGTLGAADFPLQVTDGEGTTTVVQTGVENFVDAGTYTIDEVQQAGYALTDLSCVRLDGEEEVAVGELGEDGESIVVDLGLDETIICTIENDDIAPTVVLRKTVVNDDGGTLTQDDFPVSFDGDAAAWDETITTIAGAHVAAEETQPGYLAGDWGGDCAADGSLTTNIGEAYECTITNDDVPAGLTVVKQVVNDDGGTATVADFPLTVTPAGGTSTTVTSGVETIVGAGTYTISEEQQPGYELVSISCDNGTTTTEDSIDVTVGLDEAVICTVVNDDLPISIDVIKVPSVEEIDFTAGGDEEVVTYTYTVTNTGDLPLTDVSLVDDILGDITLPVDELAVGQTILATADHVVTQADAEAGTIVNVAVVDGTSPDGRTTDDTDDAEVLVNLIEVAPQVVEKPKPAPVLPATGYETLDLAMWAALVAGLGALFLLGTGEVEARRRRRD